ncbi:ABC transporter permease [Jonquetella anthropi]|uniref:ABC transporter permease n=1 Tax=Jonquetella anthropi TaxID=428712 RepID=UPI0002D3FE16|nr:ABC transporter permease [Jonquetella anthropi]
MFAGSVAFFAMSDGMKSVSDRLGADLIVVPMDYTAKVENLLLTGAPSTFFLPKDAEEQLKRFSDVIEASTPQVFLATLSASCCASPLQLMGFDDSVFMTRNTLCQAAVDASFLLNSPLAKDKSLVSAVMVRLKPGQDAADLAMDMNRALNRGGLYIMCSHSFINGMSVTLRGAAKFALWGGAILWLLAACVISLLFSVSLNERRTEMAMLRTVGASSSQLTCMILDEVLILCLEGAVLGLLLGAFAATLSAPRAAEALKLPFLLPQLSVLLLIAGATVLLSVLTGLLAAYRAARRVSKADIYSTLRGN